MKISCIIPAYNESERISNVISVLIPHELIDDIIVVNDASTDSTEEILKEITGITTINHTKNFGKTQAVITGLSWAKNDIVMLIDADLIGLSDKAITSLAKPVLDNKADITISLRKNALSIYKILGIDFVSGERVFRKKLLLENIEKLNNLPGFGLEVFINELVISKKLRLKIERWDDVISPRKATKIGFLLGSLGDAKMIMQILSTVSLSKCMYQIYTMRKLSRN